MPSPCLCERSHPTRVSPNFRPETTFSKVAGRVRTADLQTRRLPLNPLLHGGLTEGVSKQYSGNFTKVLTTLCVANTKARQNKPAQVAIMTTLKQKEGWRLVAAVFFLVITTQK